MEPKYRIRVGRNSRPDRGTRKFKAAVVAANEWKTKRGLPVAKYDPYTDKAYLEYPDGRKEYFEAP